MKPKTVAVVLLGAGLSMDILKGTGIDIIDKRLHFNWGYHDGAADAKDGQQKSHFNCEGYGTPETAAVYAAGYKAGSQDVYNGAYKNNSTDAWEAFEQERRNGN